jgi:hypothetical protein
MLQKDVKFLGRFREGEASSHAGFDDWSTYFKYH